MIGRFFFLSIFAVATSSRRKKYFIKLIAARSVCEYGVWKNNKFMLQPVVGAVDDDDDDDKDKKW